MSGSETKDGSQGFVHGLVVWTSKLEVLKSELIKSSLFTTSFASLYKAVSSENDNLSLGK